jgi:predicted outer membrane repeat protein
LLNEAILWMHHFQLKKGLAIIRFLRYLTLMMDFKTHRLKKEGDAMKKGLVAALGAVFALVASLAVLLAAPQANAVQRKVPSPYTSIQAGIQAAQDGDEVLVSTGTYYERIVFPGDKSITVTSENPGSPSSTVINGNHGGSVVTFSAGSASCTLNGFTVTNGYAIHTFDNGQGDGAGILCRGASPTITNCNISNNQGNYGAGIACVGPACSPTISQCTISNNTDLGGVDPSYYTSGDGQGAGAGIYCSNSSPVIIKCTISYNQTERRGGGIYCKSSAAKISDCTIQNNAVVYVGDPSLQIFGAFAQMGDIGGYGGGIYAEGSATDITGSTIQSNSAKYVKVASINPYLQSGGIGGGIYAQGSGALTIKNCTINKNTALMNGGGIYNQDGGLTVINSLVVDNTATTMNGGGIYSSNSTAVSFAYCTISNNKASTNGSGGGVCEKSTTPQSMTDCIVWNNTPDEISSMMNVTYSDVKYPTGTYSGTGNINSDPKFNSSASGNYRLLATSPCIDKGTEITGVYDDRDGHERPAGNGNDMGAYEANPNLITLEQFSAEASKDGQIELTWTTGSEIDTVEFILSRSTAENEESPITVTVPAVGDAMLGADYSYIDDTAVPGVTYYYTLEDMDCAGKVTSQGTVSAVIK